MSTSLASAKKRRANITEPQPQIRQQQMQPQMQPAGGLTLQQVIKLVDTRLTTLEKLVSEQRNGGEEGEESGDWIEEFNKRTEIIAVEIDSIKSTVLQLQTFTMEVNKKMFEKLEALTNVAPPAVVAREVATTVAPVVPVPDPVPEPVSAHVVPVVPEPEPVSAPVPAITLELNPPTPVEAPAELPILSRFENKSKKNNTSTST
jgi:hypothetical protein